MQTLIAEFAKHLRGVHGRAAQTVTTYSRIVVSFLADQGLSPPGRSDVERFLSRPLATGTVRAPGTRNQSLAALRAFAAFAIARGEWSSDPTNHLRFLREPPHDPAVLSVPEVHRFFRAVDRVSLPPLRGRDRAMLALLFTLGLRVHELVGLDVEQLDTATAALLSVRGKGGSIHDLPLESSALAIVTRWLSERASVAAVGESAMFVSARGSRLSARSVERLFQRLRTHVGTQKHVTPHTARHTFVTTGSQRGAELTALADVARHRDINVTRRYLHLGGAERRRVVSLLGIVIPPELISAHLPEEKPALTDVEPGTGTPPTPASPPKNPIDAEETLHDVAASGVERSHVTDQGADAAA